MWNEIVALERNYKVPPKKKQISRQISNWLKTELAHLRYALAMQTEVSRNRTHQIVLKR